MFKRNDMQATAWWEKTKNGTRTVREQSLYPEVPAGWPNRATRRAVQKNRMDRLSAPWKAVLATRPEMVVAIRGLA